MSNFSLYLKVIFSFVIFSFFGVVLNVSSFTALQNIFLMGFLGSIWMLCVMAYKKQLSEFTRLSLGFPLLMFAIMSGLIPFFWLQSLTLIPVAQALFLLSSIPIVALLFEILVFKQKAKASRVVAIFIGILGIAILLSGGLATGGQFLSKGSIFVLIAVFFIVLQGFSIKKLGGSLSREIIIFVTVAAPALSTFLFAFQKPWHIDAISIGGALFLSIFPAIVAFYFYSEGLARLHVSTVRLIGYIEVFLGTLWGVILLSQPLLPVTIVGGILILLASYLAIKSGE